MSTGASVTANALIERLTNDEILDNGAMVSLLGEERHRITLNKLEVRLVSGNVISNNRLLRLKGAIGRRRVLDDPDIEVNPAALDAQVARATGALVLTLPDLTVAMVEDTTSNVDLVRNALGGLEFEIWFVTAPQFFELWKSAYTEGFERDRSPEVVDFAEILDEGIARRASDIHLSVGEPPTFRIDSDLVRMARQPLSTEWIQAQMEAIAGAERMAKATTKHDADFAYTFGSTRFRINIGRDNRGYTVAARKIPTKVPTCDDLGLTSAIRNLANLERGLVLVTGPTGSGKSTTLAALLASIAENQSRHIITLEDPIEFYLPAGKSLVHQRELGGSFTSFPDGLRQALRQDPDVILVGELRDQDTMRTAIMAAETGHLVFGTLHTYDTPSTVGRLVSSFSPAEQDQIRSQLAYILKGVVSQSLVKLARSQGRVAAFEVMISTNAIMNNLKRPDGQATLKQTIETGKAVGMQTMEMALADLVTRGLVDIDEAEFKAPNVDDFRRYLGHEQK